MSGVCVAPVDQPDWRLTHDHCSLWFSVSPSQTVIDGGSSDRSELGGE